jgi:hypothetical protein
MKLTDEQIESLEAGHEIEIHIAIKHLPIGSTVRYPFGWRRFTIVGSAPDDHVTLRLGNDTHYSVARNRVMVWIVSDEFIARSVLCPFFKQQGLCRLAGFCIDYEDCLLKKKE